MENSQENQINHNAQDTTGGISGSTLKWIAIITMVIDHIGAGFLENGLLPYLYQTSLSGYGGYKFWANIDMLMRSIGRMAFPIFCFLIVEGICHTSSRKKFLARLFLFGVLSEIPFDLLLTGSVCDWSHQNVMFSLFLGVLAVHLCSLGTQTGMRYRVKLLAILVGFGVLATLLRVDYGYVAIVLIFTFYLFRDQEFMRDIVAAVMMLGAGTVEIAGYVAFVPIHFYNGRRGMRLKYFFYAFYPVHLLIIAGVRLWIFH